MPTPDPNAHVIAVANLKGGVGKTTTVLNLAGFAGRMGKRVLAIDTDPQGSLSRIALPDDAPRVTLSDAFARRAVPRWGVCSITLPRRRPGAGNARARSGAPDRDPLGGPGIRLARYAHSAPGRVRSGADRLLARSRPFRHQRPDRRAL